MLSFAQDVYYKGLPPSRKVLIVPIEKEGRLYWDFNKVVKHVKGFSDPKKINDSINSYIKHRPDMEEGVEYYKKQTGRRVVFFIDNLYLIYFLLDWKRKDLVEQAEKNQQIIIDDERA